MLLHRIHLNPRSKDARRDLADPYQMHATLCRAFLPPETKCPRNALLWRLEPEPDVQGYPRMLIQSQTVPDWSRLLESGWLARTEPGIDLVQKLALSSLATGQSFRFRLRANPCKTHQKKRIGLLRPDTQREWLVRKGKRHGFILPALNTPDYFGFSEKPEGSSRIDVRTLQDQMLIGRKPDSTTIQVFSVLYEGRLVVRDPDLFRAALASGIGHGKVMGLGLLSIIPM
ncbi:MAG: type I-E CRISPR-associated protein Cas6/Cse3/CasE [Nevskiaceae bacterium]|nr:MAG: type I-E CRISPR-associated protein Cas6/Cse3/CasE [Nevskiaceae bacterium]TBR74650.1 MAG: type I-E CRISPR-associated protein Cas6/Cse3/CasE [Nevskiaceae bacterium]